MYRNFFHVSRKFGIFKEKKNLKPITFKRRLTVRSYLHLVRPVQQEIQRACKSCRENVVQSKTPAQSKSLLCEDITARHYGALKIRCNFRRSQMANSKEKISPDSKRAWLMLAIIAFSVFSNSGLQLSFGTILGALVNEFGESKSKTGNLTCLFVTH